MNPVGAVGVARRRRRSSDNLVGFVIVVGLFLWIIAWVFEQIKTLWPLLLIGSGISVGLLIVGLAVDRIADVAERRRESRRAEAERARLIEVRQRRRGDLLGRFQREDVVDAILAGQIWHDMSKDELVESWGWPAEVSTKVMKTKVKEIFKYDRIGTNRFGRRAILENDRVIGWEA